MTRGSGLGVELGGFGAQPLQLGPFVRAELGVFLGGSRLGPARLDWHLRLVGHGSIVEPLTSGGHHPPEVSWKLMGARGGAAWASVPVPGCARSASSGLGACGRPTRGGAARFQVLIRLPAVGSSTAGDPVPAPEP